MESVLITNTHMINKQIIINSKKYLHICYRTVNVYAYARINQSMYYACVQDMRL